jgi:hypothetical protein
MPVMKVNFLGILDSILIYCPYLNNSPALSNTFIILNPYCVRAFYILTIGNIYVTIMLMAEYEIKEYVREDSSPFGNWFNNLVLQPQVRLRLPFTDYSSATSRTFGPWAAGFQNARSILVPATESILGRTGTY